ncbi:MAG: TetR family transcriptional regulator [Micromonosporaceae bacterium]|nr:TetR family transcriptional regulator [Micromonosporaceae bacterium]
MARTGRRRGKPDTREAILSAAREAFAEHGYDRSSIRAIAAAAEVDPALVQHYFGNKDKLFLAAMESPIDPAEMIAEVVEGGSVDDLGERLVRTFVRVWDSPAGKPAAAMIRTMVSREWSSRLLREFLLSQILRRIAAAHVITEPDRRFPLVASQMIGLGMARYILKIEPLASAPPEFVVATIAPTVQRYLTMELPTG